MNRFEKIKNKSISSIVFEVAVVPAILSLIIIQNLYWVVAVAGLVSWAAVVHFYKNVPGAFLSGFLLFLLIFGGGGYLLYFVFEAPF